MSRRPLALWLLGLAILLAAVVGVGSLWLRGPQADVIEVQRAPLVRTLQFSARVATLSRVDIGSTLTGRVAQVRVREGAEVRKGDVLVQLEDSEWRAALVQAEAGEAQARARLAGLRSSGRSASDAALSQAEATLRAASSAFERARRLKAQGFYSDAQLDEARRVLDVAQAQQHSARAQVQANADTGTDIAQAQAQLDVARAASGAARSRLAQAQLLAPTQARVLVRSVEPGQIVQPGKALLSLALAGPTQFVAQVDERFLEQLRTGQQAAVVADAFPGQRFAARVLSIAPAVDAQRGAIEVKFALASEPPAFLREDMTLSVEVETGRRDSALVLPQSALWPLDAEAKAAEGMASAVTTSPDGPESQRVGNVRYVLVVESGRAQLRAVHLGLHTLGAVEVRDGLAEGEQVLVRSGGMDGSLQPGQRVRARPVHWAPSATGSPGNGARAEDAGSAMSNAMGR
ncbi:efflux RND transporter periplasmic adaptor subunit [Simplicispira suum]|uniref:Efflux RND transporter periplasmic adaptor subunit n=1 Tax=Simplicispira suum TaxID=2109915 RepID=A0A2S0N0Q3_9BURK|nr:efflux RND transporter periplasmic adaptor subunit [Simplicispira suum]AVO41513.1 efflux RND transporter periplasmic adaptor subunit [Simplicispira suum]